MQKVLCADLITILCNAAYPHLTIRFVFRSCTRISSFFPFKDKVPKFLKSGVVYLFKCRCGSAYMWVKPHVICTPWCQNIWESLLHVTGRPSSSPVMSIILSHLNSTGHSAGFDVFKTLSSCSNTGELMIHEYLLIYLSSNPLSMYRAAQFLSTFYNLLYHVYFVFCCLYCLVMCCPIPSCPSSM